MRGMRVLMLCSFLFFVSFSIPDVQTVTHTAHDASYERYIVIDLWMRELTLYEGDHILKQYPVAPGNERHPSPIGEWHIVQKSKGWGGGFGSRWLGLNVPWGIYGIHGTNRPQSIGRDVSHGCFRMFNQHVEELYPLVQVGMQVTVDGPLLGRDEWKPKKLFRGTKGSDVMLLQNRLYAAGYYGGPVDGDFGFDTERAVKRWQKDMKWEVTAQVGQREYLELGLLE